jgi:hypothetical protein
MAGIPTRGCLVASAVVQITGRSYRLDKSSKNSNSTKVQTGSKSDKKYVKQCHHAEDPEVLSKVVFLNE